MMHGSEIERIALDQIEPKLVRQGYRVLRSPSLADLPPFIKGYIPDAIAVGKEPNLALEIKSRETPRIKQGLSRIREMFEGHDDWVFRVYYFNSLDPVIHTLPSETLEKRAVEIFNLAKSDPQAAFILSWSILEASVREVGLLEKEPMISGPNKIISILASEGYTQGSTMSEFLELANLRNRIVHGQLDVNVSRRNVERILDLAKTVRNEYENSITG